MIRNSICARTSCAAHSPGAISRSAHFEGDRLVGYAWRTFTAAPDVDGLWVRVERPSHYLYKGFTLPSHRGKRIQVAIPAFSDRCFLEQGYTSRVGIVDIANFASLSNGKRLGRRKTGYAGYAGALDSSCQSYSYFVCH